MFEESSREECLCKESSNPGMRLTEHPVRYRTAARLQSALANQEECRPLRENPPNFSEQGKNKPTLKAISEVPTQPATYNPSGYLSCRQSNPSEWNTYAKRLRNVVRTRVKEPSATEKSLTSLLHLRNQMLLGEVFFAG
jgi:hypothetical protein